MKLSIVIPTLNRAALLIKTLQSIVDQHSVTDLFEVIVVDNGSTDTTLEVCKYFEGRISNFVYCYEDEPGQLTGRHKGTELSKGSVISFIDDDVELSPSWINTILKLFTENETVSIVGGPSLPKYQSYPPSWVSYFWQPTPYGGTMCLPLSLIDIGADKTAIDPLYVFGLNYSIRKKVLLELGGFHPDCIPTYLQKYQGDGETGLSLRAKEKNVFAMFSVSALLYHQVPEERLTPEYFEKWFYYNGVCQSFTDIRSAHKLFLLHGKVETNDNVLELGINKIRNVLSKLLKKDPVSLPDDVMKLQLNFGKCYEEGYKFHQYSFKTDNSVKEWVLKNDYWNYRLPITNVK